MGISAEQVSAREATDRYVAELRGEVERLRLGLAAASQWIAGNGEKGASKSNVEQIRAKLDYFAETLGEQGKG
jgi:hypothetical protein